MPESTSFKHDVLMSIVFSICVASCGLWLADVRTPSSNNLPLPPPPPPPPPPCQHGHTHIYHKTPSQQTVYSSVPLSFNHHSHFLQLSRKTLHFVKQCAHHRCRDSSYQTGNNPRAQSTRMIQTEGCPPYPTKAGYNIGSFAPFKLKVVPPTLPKLG